MMYVRIFPLALLVGALLLFTAGRIDVPAFWAYPALIWLTSATIYTLVGRRHPELVRERLRPPSDRDRVSPAVSLLLLVAHLGVAGLDVGRFGWSHVPLPLQLLGFALVAGGLGLVGWTLVSNPFASSAVRIQDERNHQVISTGPYAIVRHPMYLGVFLFGIGTGWALGSWWAGVAALPLFVVFVRRTLLEDRMLMAELQGYREYAARVRSRVFPGVF